MNSDDSSRHASRRKKKYQTAVVIGCQLPQYPFVLSSFFFFFLNLYHEKNNQIKQDVEPQRGYATRIGFVICPLFEYIKYDTQLVLLYNEIIVEG
jgi:hypothetical protein